MGVLCNIVNGSARQLDAGTITFALHLRIAALNATCWWEWVESESDCSDGGSRVGLTCPVAKALGIVLTERQFPVLPATSCGCNPKSGVRFGINIPQRSDPVATRITSDIMRELLSTKDRNTHITHKEGNGVHIEYTDNKQIQDQWWNTELDLHSLSMYVNVA